MHTYLFIAPALIYLVCAFLPPKQRFVISLGTVLAWLLHAAALWADAIAPGSLRVGFAMMLSAALWISVMAYWFENRNFALDGLRILVLPSAALAAILPAIFPGTMLSMEGKSGLFVWHVVIAILAYSTLTIAAFHAVLMTLQESRLHARSGSPLGRNNWFTVTLEKLPALMTMEKLLFRMIGLGFLLLSLTVVSGVFFSEELFGKVFKWDYKTAFTLLSWLLFGALLAGRCWRGWRGRTALRFTLAGFTTLLLAYVGSRFVLEVILHKAFV